MTGQQAPSENAPHLPASCSSCPAGGASRGPTCSLPRASFRRRRSPGGRGEKRSGSSQPSEEDGAVPPEAGESDGHVGGSREQHGVPENKLDLTPSPAQLNPVSSPSDGSTSNSAKVAILFYRAGLRLERRGQLSAAIGLYRQALKLDPCLDERSMYIEDESEEDEERTSEEDRDEQSSRKASSEEEGNAGPQGDVHDSSAHNQDEEKGRRQNSDAGQGAGERRGEDDADECHSTAQYHSPRVSTPYHDETDAQSGHRSQGGSEPSEGKREATEDGGFLPQERQNAPPALSCFSSSGQRIEERETQALAPRPVTRKPQAAALQPSVQSPSLAARQFKTGHEETREKLGAGGGQRGECARLQDGERDIEVEGGKDGCADSIGLLTLPQELLNVLPLYLDAFALTRLSLCCRQLHRLCGSDSKSCWRAKCLQIFGQACVSELRLHNSSWHLMYLQRPRVRLDGIYISRCMYMRRVRDVGNLLNESEQDRRQRQRLHQQLRKEQELSTSSAQLLGSMIMHQSPVLAVTYHRYLRFLPSDAEGPSKVLVLRTEADVQVAVQALKAAEQRVREVERRDGGNCNVVFARIDTRHGNPNPAGAVHQRWTWQRLLPFVAVGEFSFDPQSRQLRIFYDEPRTESSCCAYTAQHHGLLGPPNRSAGEPCGELGGQGGASSSEVTRGSENTRRGRETRDGATGVEGTVGERREEYGCGFGGWQRRRRPYTHRAVLELCGGPAAKSNCRLKWSSFSIGSARGLHEGDDGDEATQLNIDNEHFRPFVLNRVKAFESFF